MLKKTITYKDFDGNERTDDFYFNLTKAEVMEMSVDPDAGLNELTDMNIDAQNLSTSDVHKVFVGLRELILAAYGEKSADGKKFLKSEEISNGFYHSDAYSEMFMELMNDDDATQAFIDGVMPNMQELTGATVVTTNRNPDVPPKKE